MPACNVVCILPSSCAPVRKVLFADAVPKDISGIRQCSGDNRETDAWPQVEVCCFDKTGTLTSDNLLFEGVTGLPGAADSTALESAAKKLPPPVTRVLAGCQSLVRVDGQLVGDPLELAAFNAVGTDFARPLPRVWHSLICNRIVLPSAVLACRQLRHAGSSRSQVAKTGCCCVDALVTLFPGCRPRIHQAALHIALS